MRLMGLMMTRRHGDWGQGDGLKGFWVLMILIPFTKHQAISTKHHTSYNPLTLLPVTFLSKLRHTTT